MTHTRRLFLALAAFSLAPMGCAPSGGAASAQTFGTSTGPVRVEVAADGLENPWGLAFLPGGGFLVTEKEGRLTLFDGDDRIAVSGVPEVEDDGQGGLLDVAVAPDFAASGRIWLSYAAPAGRGLAQTAIASARLAREGATARLEDVAEIFRQAPPSPSGRHYGSRIVVAGDGALFVTIGDRGQRDGAQVLSRHNGKIVRIGADGGAPADNPLLSRPGALPEIWSYGHRNPQGAALRPSDGALFTVEHGARGGDEINRPEAGRNYGWPVISYGRHYSGARIGVGARAEGMEQPLHFWDPSIAPSGLAFYDGDLFPAWRGDLFVGALRAQRISRLTMDGDRVTGEEMLFDGAFGRIRDVRSGPDGALWFLTDSSDGAVHRVIPAR